MEAEILIFYVLLAIVSFLYSSVGHGGASGYLALMAFFSFAPETMRSSALLLNILVALISFIQFYRQGYFKWSFFWPFAITSVPLAFLGGTISLPGHIYKIILGIFLLFAVVRIIGFGKYTQEKRVNYSMSLAMLIGAVIGLLSGLIGIGGGIILSPVILLFGWANIKQTAAISALFILVNSISAIIPIFFKQQAFATEITYMIPIAVVGGLSGAYFGAKRISFKYLKYMLSMVLLIAAIKLILV